MENQEVIFRLGMMEQQMQQLQQQFEAVEKGIAELNSLREGLNEINGSEGKEIFARIGRGIYAKAKITSEELMVNVGENNLVNKSVADTRGLIEEQIKRLHDVRQELENNIDETNNELLALMKEYEGQKKD
ncbi:MAG: prefoldin subunit alpha [Candidatus Pacearchaeota archaeon]|nr:prefoldin subunit alpha [Candidatus Pacearchaeota archaeon]MDE1848634.1 prefoldin subunit alpha [Nanoarchaeota archaeon]